MPNLLILHLSDLHFGNQNRFADGDFINLGRAFHRAVDAARSKECAETRIQLVIVTGDIAETANPKQYDQARGFLDALSEGLGLEPARFVFLPGNHDVSWAVCKKVAADQEIEEFDDAELRRRMDAQKFQFYDKLLQRLYGHDLAELCWCRPLGSGGWVHDFPDLRLSVAAMNTCELESHRPADHRGHLGTQQAEALMALWRQQPYPGWLKIVAVHHNPIAATPANLEEWTAAMKKQANAASGLIDQYAADVLGFEGLELLRRVVHDCRAHLVLHGHHHDQGEPLEWPWANDGRAPVLSTGSFGLVNGKLPGDAPPSCQLLLFQLDPDQPRLRAFPLVYNGRFRLEGEILPGAFQVDPADCGGYNQLLHLPPSWRQAAQVASVPDHPSTEPLAHVMRYRQRMRSLFDKWDTRFLGSGFTSRLGRHADPPLHDMYVPLRFSDSYDIERTDLGAPLDIPALLARDRPLVIRGPAGSGKTTWLRYTFSQLLDCPCAIPLMVVLRDVARRWSRPDCSGANRSLDDFLVKWICEHTGSADESQLSNLLNAPAVKPILLVDGWDELGTLGAAFRAKLLGFMGDHRQVQVVVTSRPYGDSRPDGADEFDTLDIQPLSAADITELAHRFFTFHDEGNHDAVAAEVEKFLTAVQRIPEAQTMARNAFLLILMLMTSRVDVLPDKRHLLYERCINNLLTLKPLDREVGIPLPKTQFRPKESEERKRVVASLAFNVQQGGYNAAFRSRITCRWDEMVAALPQAWSVEKREGFLHWLVDVAGILTDSADGTLAFSQLSFQQYLAAWHLSVTRTDRNAIRDEFVNKLLAIEWWETLFLWVAKVAGENPDRFTHVIDVLCGFGEVGRAFAGMIMANGVGPGDLFGRWFDDFMSSEEWPLPEAIRYCAQAWATSTQAERKDAMYQRLVEQTAHFSRLPHRLRAGAFARLAGLNPMRSGASASGLIESVIDAVVGKPLSHPLQLAAGRILSGCLPLWPGAPLGILNVWPSHRRRMGFRLQLAVLCGASANELPELLRWMVGPNRGRPSTPQSTWGPQWRHEYPLWLPHWKGELHNVFASYLRDRVIRYWSQLWPQQLSPPWVGALAPEIAANWADDWARDRVTEWADDWISDWADGWDGLWLGWLRSSGVYPRDLAQTFVANWEKRHSTEWANDRANQWGIDNPDWLREFARLDFAAAGRSGCRAILALMRDAKSREIQLMGEACQLSLDLTGDPRRLETALDKSEHGTLHPLWPALARHVARRSTRDDLDVLSDLAENPGHCEDRDLSWALQYIVRGDVVLADGTDVTLDSLFQGLDLPSLSYVEIMPTEWTPNK